MQDKEIKHAIMKTLSIIIPAYNAERYITTLLSSLEAQKEADKERYDLVIVNDGSTDSTSEKIVECMKKYPRLHITLIEQENAGVSAARNRGLYAAKGDYVWFVDADDFIECSAICNIIKVIEAHDVDVIRMGRSVNGYLHGDDTDPSPYHADTDLSAYIITEAYELLREDKTCSGHQGFLWKRQFLCNNSLKYPENISNNEDTLFVMKVLMKGEKAYVNTTMRYYLYRSDIKSLSRGDKTFKSESKLMTHKLLFLEEAIKMEAHEKQWNKDKQIAYREKLAVEKELAIERLLLSRQSLSYIIFFTERLKSLGCFPYDDQKKPTSLKSWMYKTPWAIALCSAVLSVNFIYNGGGYVYKLIRKVKKKAPPG